MSVLPSAVALQSWVRMPCTTPLQIRHDLLTDAEIGHVKVHTHHHRIPETLAMRLALYNLPRQHPVHAVTRAAPRDVSFQGRAAAGADARGVFDAFGFGSNVTIFDARWLPTALAMRAPHCFPPDLPFTATPHPVGAGTPSRRVRSWMAPRRRHASPILAAIGTRSGSGSTW